MKIDKRRRIEGKTDYRRRLILLKSDLPRLVVRKTNRYLILQIVETKSAQDKILFSVTSKDLIEHGWPEASSGSLKSLTAGYLAGFLLGKKAKMNKELILDIGLNPSTKAGRIYAVVKGISDSGLKIRHDKEVLPTLEQIETNSNIDKQVFNKIKEAINHAK